MIVCLCIDTCYKMQGKTHEHEWHAYMLFTSHAHVHIRACTQRKHRRGEVASEQRGFKELTYVKFQQVLRKMQMEAEVAMQAQIDARCACQLLCVCVCVFVCVCVCVWCVCVCL
jgi:hypothetical protein